MSQFMPEGFGSAAAPQSNVANPETTDTDVELMKRVLSAAAARPNLIPNSFLAYVIDYIQTSNLVIPIGQVFGYQNSVDKIVTQSVAAALAGTHVATSETEVNITSSSYATFSGAPGLSGLDDGHYVVLWGTSGNADSAGSGSQLLVVVQANGTTNTNPAETQTQAIHVSIARGDIVTLNAGAGANSLAMLAKTLTAGHTSVVRHSWLLATKYANL